MENTETESTWIEIIDIFYHTEFDNLDYGWGVSPEKASNSEDSLRDLLVESQIEYISDKIGKEENETEIILRNMVSRGLLYEPVPDDLDPDNMSSENRYSPNLSSTYTLSKRGFDIAHDIKKREQENKRLKESRYTSIAIAVLTFGLLIMNIFKMALDISLSDAILFSWSEPTEILIYAIGSVAIIYIFVAKTDLIAFEQK